MEKWRIKHKLKKYGMLRRPGDMVHFPNMMPAVQYFESKHPVARNQKCCLFICTSVNVIFVQ